RARPAPGRGSAQRRRGVQRGERRLGGRAGDRRGGHRQWGGARRAGALDRAYATGAPPLSFLMQPLLIWYRLEQDNGLRPQRRRVTWNSTNNGAFPRSTLVVERFFQIAPHRAGAI